MDDLNDMMLNVSGSLVRKPTKMYMISDVKAFLTQHLSGLAYAPDIKSTADKNNLEFTININLSTL
tara:strand:+ start:197 stop:394 length:198 start_codon:yes stop_codon:yes gene_type:complete